MHSGSSHVVDLGIDRDVPPHQSGLNRMDCEYADMLVVCYNDVFLASKLVVVDCLPMQKWRDGLAACETVQDDGALASAVGGNGRNQTRQY